MEIIFIALLVVVLWYFGSTLSRGAETLNTLADTRLDDMEADQIITSAKRRASITKKAQKMAEKGEVSLSNKELRDLLKSKKEA